VTNLARPTERVVALLQPARHGGAIDQGRQRRDQVDPAVMPHLRYQCRPPPAPCVGLQPRPLHADAGDAEGGALWSLTSQDRREGRQPWPLPHVPNGQSRGVAPDVRRHPVADRSAAGAARAGVRGREAGTRGGKRRKRCAQIGQSRAFQRLSAINCRFQPPSAASASGPTLPRMPERKIMTSQPLGIRGMSDERSGLHPLRPAAARQDRRPNTSPMNSRCSCFND
jgi:hypothetical protein